MSSTDRPSASPSTADQPDAEKPVAKICDVTLRDGLQGLDQKAAIDLEARFELFEDLRRARIPYIEIGSWVNYHVMPSMAPTPELAARIGRTEAGEAETVALVPTRKYFDKMRAADHSLTTVALLVSASEKYSKLNTKMSNDDALQAACEVTRMALDDGLRVRAYLSYSFREMDDTPVELDPIRRVCARLLDEGCELIAVSDTAGTARPEDIRRVIGALSGAVDLDGIGIHLHDRYGLGITNCHVAWEEGVRTFDSALGGIGGNKMVKGAVSNVATEELVFMLHAIGVETGIDFPALVEAGRRVETMIEQLNAPPTQSKILLNSVERLPALM